MSKVISKEIIISTLRNDILAKISDIQVNIEHLKNSLNSETKSSMGDKYETGRSMIHAEIENYNKQLANHIHDQNVLNSIKRQAKNKTSDFGSLIFTNNGIYFLGVGLGKIIIQDQAVYCVSGNSPIGKKFQNRIAGDTVDFMEHKILIEEIQ